MSCVSCSTPFWDITSSSETLYNNHFLAFHHLNFFKYTYWLDHRFREQLLRSLDFVLNVRSEFCATIQRIYTASWKRHLQSGSKVSMKWILVLFLGASQSRRCRTVSLANLY